MRTLILLLFLLIPNVLWAQPANVVQAAQRLEQQGYFQRCANGDHKACSYFVRLLVWTVNPNGDGNNIGALRKGGGHNVDGYAEDAIVLNANPNDLNNVVDLVAGAGAPGARLQWGGPVNRRASDTWEAPSAPSEAMLDYLLPHGDRPPVVQPPTPTQPPPQPIPDTTLQGVLDRLARLEDLLLSLHTKANDIDEHASDTLETVRGFGDSVIPALDRIQELLTSKPTVPPTIEWPEYVGNLFGRTVVLRPR